MKEVNKGILDNDVVMSQIFMDTLYFLYYHLPLLVYFLLEPHCRNEWYSVRKKSWRYWQTSYKS